MCAGETFYTPLPASPLKVNPGQCCWSLACIFAGQGSCWLWGHQRRSKDIFVVKLGTETNTSPSRYAYMKPAFCLVLQQILGANLAKETFSLQQILLKTKLKTHQPPSPPNLPDASHRGNLASRPAAIAAPREPRLLSLCCCCCCFFPSSCLSLFTARQSRHGTRLWSRRKRRRLG